MKRFKLFAVLMVGVVLFSISCKKDSAATDSLYIPTVSDVTANATLTELQQGRTIYQNSCGACHGLYSPDSFAPSTWRSIMGSMAPKAKLSTANTLLVTKYVTRGN
jgi:cytochrome c5